MDSIAPSNAGGVPQDPSKRPISVQASLRFSGIAPETVVALHGHVALKWIYRNGRVVAVDPDAPDVAADGLRTFSLRPFVYVATPYAGEDAFSGLRTAINAGEELRQRGCAVFLPQLFIFWHLVHPHAEEEWLGQCLEWLEQCDVLFLAAQIDEVDIEIAHAEQLGIPVVRSLDDLDAWLAQRGEDGRGGSGENNDPSGAASSGNGNRGSGLGLSDGGQSHGAGEFVPVREHANLPHRGT